MEYYDIIFIYLIIEIYNKGERYYDRLLRKEESKNLGKYNAGIFTESFMMCFYKI